MPHICPYFMWLMLIILEFHYVAHTAFIYQISFSLSNCNSHIAKKKEESQSLMCLDGDNLSFQARTHHNNTGHLSTDLFMRADYLSRKWSVHKLITFANLDRDVRHWSNQKMQTLSIQLIKTFCWLLITCLATSWVQKSNFFLVWNAQHSWKDTCKDKK